MRFLAKFRNLIIRGVHQDQIPEILRKLKTKISSSGNSDRLKLRSDPELNIDRLQIITSETIITNVLTSVNLNPDEEQEQNQQDDCEETIDKKNNEDPQDK